MLDLADYPHVHQPFEHQAEALEKTWHLRDWALFMEMGTGKSKILIDTAAMLYFNDKIDLVFVFAKKGEYANWRHVEIPTHLPPEIAHQAYLFNTIRHRSAPGKAAWKKFLDTSERRLRFMIINIEALGSELCLKAINEAFKTSKGRMLIVDESTCVKNPKAARTKRIYALAAKCHYRRIATGTPVTQSPMDLWGQFQVFDKGKLGCSNFYSFQARYSVVQTIHLGPQRSIKKVVGYQRLEELGEVVSRSATIKSKDECLDLPPKIYKRVAVEMTPMQAKLYNQLRDEAMATINGHDINVTNALSLIVKLHQVACGQLKIDDTRYETIENNRLDALVDVLDEHRGKALIWAGYRQTLDDVHRRLVQEHGPEVVAPYYGGVGIDERQDALSRFQDPSDPLRFIVANPQSAGYGLTLTQATLAVYYSNSYNLEHRLQSEDRCHRIGQTERVVYVDLYVPGTVDEKIMHVLADKKNLADTVIRGEGGLAWILS